MDKMSKKELFFYLLVSLTIILTFTGYLAYRYVKHVVIGPLIFLLYLFLLLFCAPLFIHAVKKSIHARYLFFKFIAMAGAIVFILLVTEIFFREINFPPMMKKDEIAVTRLNLERIKTLIALKEKGLNAMLFVAPGYMRKFSNADNSDLYLSNMGNAYLVEYEEEDGLIVYKSDSNGFRNPANLYESSKSFDVFLLGDSFTQGSSVPDGYTIADKIREGANVTVYNAGIGGSGLITQLAIFLEYGLRKKPKNVVLVLVEGVGLTRAYLELNDDHLKRYWESLSPRSLYQKNSVKDEHLREFAETESLNRLLEYAEKDVERNKVYFSLKDFFASSRVKLFLKINFIEKNSEKNEGFPNCEKMESSEKIIEKLFKYYQSVTKEYGGNFSVVYLPDSRYYSSANWQDCEYQMVLSLCQEMDIPVVDMVKKFSEFSDPRSFFAVNYYDPKIGGHCNRKGYELVAKEIVNQLSLKGNRQ
ncbi:MAG: hypothetical protein A3D10_01780 [Omnitrophica WOR_2 bacterium RIFCSPHIGHO2_02_FULL_48_11]|nr:MAG: hypothetical protein A3D10_01780 [Omnitrophica WOR_2 bacterium RIFCSPHIGHO2_02_FULL_48_11]